jgi:hypothetical protein
VKLAALIVALAGLAFIWRRDAVAADKDSAPLGAAAADAPAGLAEGTDTASAAEAVDLDVTNTTANTQNSLTIGNDARTEVGGDLVLGGGTSGGLDPGDGTSGGSGNTINTEQNTITIGNDSVFHVGSGRRPARSSDYEEFWNAHPNATINVPGSNTRALFQIADSAVSLERQAESGALKTLGFGTKPGVEGVSVYEQIVALWNQHFGNVIAFPGQPIN